MARLTVFAADELAVGFDEGNDILLIDYTGCDGRCRLPPAWLHSEDRLIRWGESAVLANAGFVERLRELNALVKSCKKNPRDKGVSPDFLNLVA
jgi:hypothetical protein